MPRPRKKKRVCQTPPHRWFGVLEGETPKEQYIVLLIEEFEAVRLIDTLGFTQAECAEQMAVARTTVQSLYESARKKIGETLAYGIPMRIEGGSHRFCTEEDRCERRRACDFSFERNRKQSQFLAKDTTNQTGGNTHE